jgi:acyl-coenzyme A synthetase/AMP-(fatty) acid ligase
VIFVDALFGDLVAEAIADVRTDLAIGKMVLISDGDVEQDVDYEDLIGAGRPIAPDEPDEEAPVVLMYTGGTTGLPKGVLLDHRHPLPVSGAFKTLKRLLRQPYWSKEASEPAG